MELAAFVAFVRDNIRAFEKHQREGNREGLEDFPLKRTHEQWHDLFVEYMTA